jgi:predicted small lipoprotein YifL
MKPLNVLVTVLAMLGCLLLGGCGQKGPLVPPPPAKSQVMLAP